MFSNIFAVRRKLNFLCVDRSDLFSHKGWANFILLAVQPRFANNAVIFSSEEHLHLLGLGEKVDVCLEWVPALGTLV